MNKESIDNLVQSNPWIIVKKLTKKIVEKAIKAYVEKNDAYWLKFHHFSVHIEENVFDRLQREHMKDSKESNKFLFLMEEQKKLDEQKNF